MEEDFFLLTWQFCCFSYFFFSLQMEFSVQSAQFCGV